MYEQLLLHLLGDFLLQNEWIALNKRQDYFISLAHSMIYTLPFLLVTHSGLALILICLSHSLIDRFDVVKPMNRIKNSLYMTDSGLRPDRPDHFVVWLHMFQDCSLHLIVNYLIIKYC